LRCTRETADRIGEASGEVRETSDRIRDTLGLHHTLSISALVGTSKKSSSSFINDKKWFYGKFSWQDGYGAFTYSRSQVDDVFQYIKNQQKHHKKSTFKQEYILLLEKFGIENDEKYLFTFF
jgi:hypothetical protein